MIKGNQLALSNKHWTIIDKVKDKIHGLYPDIIDLIGVTGSVHRGDNHPMSDLDLCIIVADGYEDKFTSRFMIEGICYDIYLTSWSRLEKASQYPHPYVTKLMEMTLVYDKGDWSKTYYDLRTKLRDSLGNPEAVNKAKTYFDQARLHYADLMVASQEGQARYHLNLMVHQLELCLYMVNGQFVSGGQGAIPREVLSFSRLPRGFDKAYRSFYKLEGLGPMKDLASDMIRACGDFLSSLNQAPVSDSMDKKIALAYMELSTNWLNKLRVAIQREDLYSIHMIFTFTQEIYQALCGKHQKDMMTLFTSLKQESLEAYEQAYQDLINHLRTLSSGVDKYLEDYKSLDDFTRDY